MKKILCLVLIVGLCGCSGNARHKLAEKRFNGAKNLFYARQDIFQDKYDALSAAISENEKAYGNMVVAEGGMPTMRNVNLIEGISIQKSEALELLIEEYQKTQEYAKKLEQIITELIGPKG